MNQEHDYVNYFYEKYEGRVAIGVGYDQNLSDIYPFVYEDIAAESIGIAALAVCRWESISYVHIYHIDSFKSSQRDGNQILQALCLQTDRYQIQNLIFSHSDKLPIC